MKTRGLRSLLLGALLFGFACSDDPPAAPATPEAASSGAAASSSAATTTTAAAADPAPSQTSSAGGSVATDPTATAVTSGSASASASPSGPAPSTGTTPVTAATLESLKKLAKKGVLPAGEADKIMKVGAPPQVILLEAGSDPKSEIKYAFKTSTSETTIMTMDMTMRMDMGQGSAPPVPLPQVEMALDMKTAGAAEPNGDMKLSGVVSSVKVNAGASSQEQQVAKAMGDSLAGIKGMNISYFVSPKGRTHGVKVDLPKDAPPQGKMMVDQMQQSFENLMAPLPDEAVGVGAKWVVLTRVASGADIIQWTTYTLRKRDGDKLELEASVSQLAASPKITAGPAGTADVQSFSSSGVGLTYMDVTHVAPDKGLADVKSSMTFSARGQGMTIDTTVKIQFARK